MGLRIMGYRAGMMGGSLDIRNEAAGGASVVCKVPLSVEGDTKQRPTGARHKN